METLQETYERLGKVLFDAGRPGDDFHRLERMMREIERLTLQLHHSGVELGRAAHAFHHSDARAIRLRKSSRIAIEAAEAARQKGGE